VIGPNWWRNGCRLSDRIDLMSGLRGMLLLLESIGEKANGIIRTEVYRG